MRKYLILGLTFLLIVAVAGFAAACGTSNATTTTAAPSGSTTSSQAVTTSQGATTSEAVATTATTAAPAAKSIKVGVVAFLGWPLGLETQKSIQVLTDQINLAGGLDVGGEKYKIELAVVDSKQQAEAARSGVEKLIQQDKVQFIVGDETSAGWLELTEAAKIPVVSMNPVPDIVAPKYNYSFQGSPVDCQFAEFYGWYAQNYPSVKKIMVATPDNEIGHISGGVAQQAGKAFGFEVTEVLYYPPDSTDFTAIAAKVKSSNPDGFVCQAGGPQSDALVLKAVVQSGYKGAVFQSAPLQSWYTSIFVPLDQLNGMVGNAYAVEQTDMSAAAKSFMDAYKAAYPKDLPEGTGSNMFAIILAGLQKAGTVDPDKVTEAIASGLEYESPLGMGKMMARPDQGNTRTVDTFLALSIKKIENGTASIVHVMTLDEAYGYVKQFYGWQ
jgi:branched-chain amino acid transport system substrate-binding protein